MAEWDPVHDAALVNTIRELKERATQAQLELEHYRRAAGMPDFCNLFADGGTRCVRVSGHEGACDAWATGEVPRAIRAWREAQATERQSTGKVDE